MSENVAKASMFFAGLILLIPHRIGMSRVNYVIKRYKLPISRAGLLLYKFHNPIEVSLTIGNVFGAIITTITTAIGGEATGSEPAKIFIGVLMIIVLLSMLLSSIFMFIIYILGDDFGYLDHFYFSLILITLFDGFTNAFAFCINATNASLYAAAIPTSGALVSLLHNIYKFLSDYFHWDNFDYYVLLLQLLCNVLTLLANIGLWSVDAVNQTGDAKPVASIMELFKESHAQDWYPILLLAISLGTVYAFYPSIAPYSIIEYQYASVIELWILIISAIPPLVIAYKDFKKEGPSGGKLGTPSSQVQVNHPSDQSIPNNTLQVQHTGNVKDEGHAGGQECSETTTWHDYKSTGNVTINNTTDQYWDPYKSTSGAPDIIPYSSSNKNIKFKAYQNWFYSRNNPTITDAGGSVTIRLGTFGSGTQWFFVWICAIFYILCIQIFMSILHYPDSLLSQFFNNKYAIGFISVLFNTVRELMQACGFSGAGKQIGSTTDSVFETYTITEISKTSPKSPGQVKLNIPAPTGSTTKGNYTDIRLNPNTSPTIKVWRKYVVDSGDYVMTESGYINTTISATNKLITLFVMIFCVFTGDGYLQHYRRCCRDCWPTTGYIRGQSFRYWLRCGFKGGSKSFTTSFTDMYHRNIRPQIISYA